MRRVKEMLRVNLPFIKVIGTDFDENMYVPTPYGNTYSKSYYNYHYKWNVADKSYPDMHAAFVYDEKWPMEFYARPSSNNMLKSNVQKGFDQLSFLCLQIWHFTYDIRYPVMVSITDDKTSKHDSYLFNFAFKVSIEHNYPNRANYARSIYEQAPTENSEEFCNTLSKEITIYTADKETTDDLTGVNLSFTCGRFKCEMGSSEWLSYGAAAGITKQFPYCVIGILRGTKEGYDESHSFIQSDVEGKSYTLYMTPVKEIKKYRIVKHPYSSPNIEYELGKDEKATIMIQNGDYSSYLPYPVEEVSAIKLFAKNDFSYNVTVYLTKDDKVIGGYIGVWNVDWQKLKSSNEIKFHVLESNFGTEEESYLFMSGLNSYSKSIPAPELK